MNLFPPEQYARMMELLSGQKSFLSEFLLITKQIPGVVDSEDTGALTGYLDKRQELLDKIAGLQDELEPLLGEYLKRAPSTFKEREEQKALFDLRAGVGALLTEIQELDQKNSDKMVEYMDRIQSDLDRTRSTREGAKAYAQSSMDYYPGYFNKTQ